jgi:CRP/FNR family transcriptional regulator, cyclic AMP receptor protein
MDDEPFDIERLTRRGVPLKRFQAGERIFLEDDHAGCMYVVRTGTVDVITFGTVLETVGAGGMFGEIGLIDGGVRSAAALASETTEVAVIDRDSFDALVREEPDFAQYIMRLLVARIRQLASG